MTLYQNFPRLIKEISGCFTTQEMRINLAVFFHIPDSFKTQEMCNKAVEEEPSNLRYVPDLFKTEEMCDKAVLMEPLLLMYISNHLKTEGHMKQPLKKGYRDCIMPLITSRHWRCVLRHITHILCLKMIRDKSQRIFVKGHSFNPYTLRFVPDHFKTQDMCDKAVRTDPGSLECVPNHFNSRNVRCCSDGRSMRFKICS